jgi:hypothetical protein
MKRCTICGLNKADGKNLIYDNNYCINADDGCIVCSDCFKHWQTADDVYLIKKIRRKLEGNK